MNSFVYLHSSNAVAEAAVPGHEGAVTLTVNHIAPAARTRDSLTHAALWHMEGFLLKYYQRLC